MDDLTQRDRLILAAFCRHMRNEHRSHNGERIREHLLEFGEAMVFDDDGDDVDLAQRIVVDAINSPVCPDGGEG